MQLKQVPKSYLPRFGFGLVLLSAAAVLTGLLNYQESYMPAVYTELVQQQTRHSAYVLVVLLVPPMSYTTL